MKKIKISWRQYYNNINKIIDNIDIKKYQYLYGIPRGGSLLALLMSYKTNIPILDNLELCNTDVNKVLILDDILDSGKTMIEYNYIDLGYDIVTMFKNTQTNINILYYAEEKTSEDWIVFPYEISKDKLSKVTIDNITERYIK